MRIVFWICLIFAIELASSYCADSRTLKIVARKKYWAVLYNSLAEGFTWLALVLVVVNRLYFPYILSAVAGNTLGTWMIASRKVKNNKHPARKKKKSDIVEVPAMAKGGNGPERDARNYPVSQTV